VPHHFIKHALRNLISYASCIKIAPYEFLETLEGMSKSIQHHCKELELLSHSVGLPRGNYLRAVLTKFPGLASFTLSTAKDILFEELARLLPVEEAKRISQGERDVSKLKSLAEESSHLLQLPAGLSTFKFGSKLKDSSCVECSSCELDIALCKRGRYEVYTVRADKISVFYSCHKLVGFVPKHNGEEDTLTVNNCINVIFSGGCRLVNYRDCADDSPYFTLAKLKISSQVRIKVKDISNMTTFLNIRPDQISSTHLAYLNNCQALTKPGVMHVALKLKKNESELFDETDEDTCTNYSMAGYDMKSISFKGLRYSSIDISDFDLTDDEFQSLMKEVQGQSHLCSINTSICSAAQIKSVAETFAHNVVTEFYKFKLNEKSLFSKLQAALKALAKKKWVAQVRVNNVLVYSKGLTTKASC